MFFFLLSQKLEVCHAKRTTRDVVGVSRSHRSSSSVLRSWIVVKGVLTICREAAAGYLASTASSSLL